MLTKKKELGRHRKEGDRRNKISYTMALTWRSKRGEVQPKISPGDRGRHCGTSTSYSGLRAALTAWNMEEGEGIIFSVHIFNQVLHF